MIKLKKLLITIISHLLPSRINKKIQRILQESLGIGAYLTFKPIKKLILKDVNVIFDIGASYGNYTQELLAHYPKAQYFLFEPAKVPYQHLLSKFKNYPNINIFNYAVSDTDCFTTLYSNTKGSQLSSLYRRDLDYFDIKFDCSEKIKAIKLSTFFKDNFSNQNFKINFCKLVVEGHEFSVLNSIKNNFNKFEAIQFEFGGCNIDSRIFFKDFWLLLNKNFDIYLISPSGPIPVKEYSELDEVFTMTYYCAVNKN